MVKITVKTCSICAMNLLPAVSLSGSSGSWRASMIENAMIKNSDSCENHLREANRLVGQARSSAFGRAELWRTICGRPRARTSSNWEAPPPTPSFPPSPRAAAALLPLPLFLLGAVVLESARGLESLHKSAGAGLLT